MDEIVDAIASRRYRFDSEAQLHDQIADALDAAGLFPEREQALTSRDRVDFFVKAGDLLPFENVAIEVKVAGAPSVVLAQLARYAESPLVDAIVLATSKSSHRTLPDEVAGKPLRVVMVRRWL